MLTTGLILKLPVFGTPPNPLKYKASKQFNATEETFQNRIPDILKKMRKDSITLKGLYKFLNPDPDRKPAAPLPQITPDLKAFLAPSKDLKVIWLGHSTFLLNLNSKIILVDPVLTESAAPFSFIVKRFQPPALKLEDLPQIDFIVISHDHYDHLDMKSIKHFVGKNITFLAPLGVSAHLISWGIEESKIIELDWWQSHKIGNIDFIATPAQHFSGRSLTDNCKTLWASWIIRNPHTKIFFSGDSGYDTHFKAIGDKYGPFDIAFIENGQYNDKWKEVHAIPEQSVQAYFDLKAKRYFPVHWGMFVLAMHTWREPMDRLLKLSQERGVNLVTPLLGEIVTVNNTYKNKTWWVDLK